MSSSRTLFLLRLDIQILVLALYCICRKPLVGETRGAKVWDYACHPSYSGGQQRRRPATLGEEEVGVSVFLKLGRDKERLVSVVLTMVLDSGAQRYFLVREKLHGVIAAPTFSRDEAWATFASLGRGKSLGSYF